MLRFLTLAVLISVCWSRSPFPDHTDDNFQNDIVNAHNHYRQLHGAPALHVDQDLVAYAKSRCALISQYQGLSHGHAGLKQGVGENLYWGANSDPTLYSGTDAVKAWYSEIKDYDFSSGGFSSSTGHFTQLVWKSTTKVGCARCGGNGGQWYETYVGCNYSPPGNYQGQFAQNVLPRH